MFGYVKPLVGELKIREFELYKSFYCGLCREMGKISKLSKFALNYDIVFLALVRIAILGEKFVTMPMRCKFKPLKKRRFATNGESISFSSAAAIILTYYKFMDDISDTKNAAKKVILHISSPIFRGMYKKAKKTYPVISDKIDGILVELRESELSDSTSIDLPASLFGEIMAVLFSHGVKDEHLVNAARGFGFQLGRWIYFADALDDFSDDKKNGTYNPFTRLYGSEEVVAENEETIRNIMSCSLESIYEAFLQFEECEVTPVIRNIITLGLCAQQERILKKFGERLPITRREPI